MDTAPKNGVALTLTPQQLCVVLVLEAQSQQLGIAANQLGGYLRLEGPADVLMAAKKHIDDYKAKFVREVQGGIVLATSADLPKTAKT